MDAQERREVIARLNNLAHYVAAGLPLEWHEPPQRGRGKRPKREESHTLTFTVFQVAQFDAIGWELMRRDMAKRGQAGERH